MQAINDVRQKIWKQQEDSFFGVATIEADGTMVETFGETKQGIGMNYKRQWGYHPLVITLAQTQEVLYLVNRSGNRPSHENSSFFLTWRSINAAKPGSERSFFAGTRTSHQPSTWIEPSTWIVATMTG